MANNNQNPPANLNNHCSFKFTFEFCSSIPSSQLYRKLEKKIGVNQKKAVRKNKLKKSFFPNGCTIKIASNVCDLLWVTKSNNKLIFECVEYSDQQDLYPDTDEITVACAVIFQSCLDLMKKYAQRIDPYIHTVLFFDFSTNSNTFFESKKCIWGANILPKNGAKINNNVNFKLRFDGHDDSIIFLDEFFKQYKCLSGTVPARVAVDCHIARKTWGDIFKNMILRPYSSYKSRNLGKKKKA